MSKFLKPTYSVADDVLHGEVLSPCDDSETLNAKIERMVMQVEAPNGAPPVIFMPLVSAVLRRLLTAGQLDELMRDLIERRAKEANDSVGQEAEAVGCGHEDGAESRRRVARRASLEVSHG